MDPNGSTPPSVMMTRGSINHFFSGIGRGTALILQGKSGCPFKFLPRTVPTRVNGRMTKRQMQVTAT